MGVSTLPNRIGYTGDGVTLSFNFPYYFFAKADLLVFVYDTLLGGITTKVLNTDFTISGTPNAQGLYASGANVVFVTAPLTTDKVVIDRAPSNLQNYALLQNATINSTALVQQMDYLTLLVQHLQDQVSRAIKLPDGFAPTFDAVLPGTMALNPNYLIGVNPTGDGVALLTTEGNPLWQSASVDYTDLQTAATSNSFTLFSLPAGYILLALAIKHSVAFAGTSITGLTAQIGISSDHGKFVDAFNAFQTVSDTAFDYMFDPYIASWASGTNILLTGVSTGANLSALTAGNVTVSYWIMKVR
jgi:hypothetical protein